MGDMGSLILCYRNRSSERLFWTLPLAASKQANRSTVCSSNSQNVGFDIKQGRTVYNIYILYYTGDYPLDCLV